MPVLVPVLVLVLVLALVPVLVLALVPIRMQNAMIKPPGLPSQRKSGQPFPMNESHLHPIKALALERNGVAMMVALAEVEAAVAVALAEEAEAVAEVSASN
jgi:hypothetical protein